MILKFGNAFNYEQVNCFMYTPDCHSSSLLRTETEQIKIKGQIDPKNAWAINSASGDLAVQLVYVAIAHEGKLPQAAVLLTSIRGYSIFSC